MPENISEIKAERVTETLVVYQQKGVFSFGTDAMLLADYVSEQQSAAGTKKLCDLCSGTGILSLVLCDRFLGLAAEAIEINPAAAQLSEKSAAESGLAERFHASCADIKNVRSLFDSESFDFVVCNPPYMRADSGKHCDHPMINLARHEIACSVYDAFAAAFYLLRTADTLILSTAPTVSRRLWTRQGKIGSKSRTCAFSRCARNRMCWILWFARRKKRRLKA